MQNSAVRIGSLFERMLSLGNMSMLEAWSCVFNVPVDSPLLFECMSGVAVNFKRFEQELEVSSASDRAKGLYRGAASNLWTFAAPGSFASLVIPQLHQNRDSIDLMFLAGDVIAGLSDPEVNPLTVDAIASEIASLLADLEGGEIDPLLRDFLKMQLSNLLVYINSFSLFGMEGVSRIFGATVSEILRASGMSEAKSPEARSWLAKARGTLKKVGEAVIWAAAVVGAGDSALEHSTHLLSFSGLLAAEASDGSQEGGE